MLRRMLWFAFSLFPIVSFVRRRRSESYTPSHESGMVVRLRAVWAAHYGFFVLHPFFNRAVSDMKRKAAWSALTLMFYPFVPPIYAWLCTGGAHGNNTD